MKKYWGFIGWLVSIALSIYMYIMSSEEREPTFIVNPLKPLIINKSLLKNQPINITDTLGDTIKTNVRVITFYFFNQGRESIRRENILEPLFIKISEGRILDLRILKVSRGITDLKFGKVDSQKQSIGFDFRILERYDGFTGQIIVAGNGDTDVFIDGTIEGAGDIRNSYVNHYKWIYSIILLIIFIMLFAIPIYYILCLGNSKPKLSLSERLKSKYQLVIRAEDRPNEISKISFTYWKLMAISSFISLLLFIIGVLAVWNIFEVKPKVQNTIEVPVEIR